MAYFVDAGDHPCFVDYIADQAYYETERVCGLIYAQTRGRAKSLFLKAERRNIEFRDIRSCRQIGEADHLEGSADIDDPLWERVP